MASSEMDVESNPTMELPSLELRLKEAEEILLKETAEASDFQKSKLRAQAARNWDIFYKRNTTNFFKDRHWTDREFAEELEPRGYSRRLLEVGCGVGNFIFPMLERNPDLFIYGCDFSPRAVEFVKENELYDESRCSAFVNDLTKDPLTLTIPKNSLDIVSAIFVLSAIPPEKLKDAVSNIASVLKEGGRVVFRDYARCDLAQMRFKSSSRVEKDLYVRQDGTLAYFFTIENTEKLFHQAGFNTVRIELVERNATNRKQGKFMQRIFVQAVFEKQSVCNDRIPVSSSV